MKNDFDWFVKNLKKLYEEYGNCYLAIKNNKVLGKYNTLVEGVRETEKTEELGTFIVQRCGADESVYTDYIASIISY